MGLAASQARFLNLVARKTNIEYEGQQINQQRTTLANQSANYYNSMLTLQVPTPPSTETYKNIVYTVSNGSDTFTLNQMTNGSASGLYNVAYTQSFLKDVCKTSDSERFSVTNTNGSFASGANVILDASATDSPLTAEIIASVKEDMGMNNSDTLYYMNRGTEAAPRYEYFKGSELPSNNSTSTVNGYSYREETQYTQGVFTDAKILRDANNRVISIQHSQLGSKSINVSSKTMTDDAAYEEAYNEYTYQTYLYQQQLDNINAQTSVIQAQDKKLELRLKQLDTEQSAISTEMESISSVIEKNVDDSFKTFA